MAITNESKPTTGVPQTELNVGSGYNLLISNTYKLIIGALNVTAGMTNKDKASVGETWGTIATTWAGETQTWLEASQLIGNTSKPTTSITNTSKPA